MLLVYSTLTMESTVLRIFCLVIKEIQAFNSVSPCQTQTSSRQPYLDSIARPEPFAEAEIFLRLPAPTGRAGSVHRGEEFTALLAVRALRSTTLK